MIIPAQVSESAVMEETIAPVLVPCHNSHISIYLPEDYLVIKYTLPDTQV